MEVLIIHYFSCDICKVYKIKGIVQCKINKQKIAVTWQKGLVFLLASASGSLKWESKEGESGIWRVLLCSGHQLKQHLLKKFLGKLRNGNQCLEIHLCWIITLCKWWEERWSGYAGKGQWDYFGSHLCLDTVMCPRIYPWYWIAQGQDSETRNNRYYWC